MKRIIYLGLLALLFVACTQDETSTVSEPEQKSFNLDHIDNVKRAVMNFDEAGILSLKFEELRAASKERRTNSLKSGCVSVAKVPEEFSTIQEAVDAVCEGGNVIVKSGTYTEYVTIIASDIFLLAQGEVIVNGGFSLQADGVKIHNFNIDGTTAFAGTPIGSINQNGFDIRNNTIYGTGHIAIYFKHCDNAQIVNNTIFGDMEAAIYIDSFRFGAGFLDQSIGDSKNNLIANNNISDIIGDLQVFYPGFGIILRGDCDDNRIQGNNVNTTNGWGISLESITSDFDENTDNNILLDNEVRNAAIMGIELWNFVPSPDNNLIGGSNNVVGPNNESYGNGVAGIYLHYGSSNNQIYNNIASANQVCDIVDLGINNSFKNNTSECVFLE